MLEFKMHTNLVFADTLREFAESENLGAGDFILTNEFLYEKYLKPLNLSCGAAFLESYGQGEPTTAMVDAIRADLPQGVKRVVAIGGGAVMDTAKCSLSTPPPGRPRPSLTSAPARRSLPGFSTCTPSPPPAARAAK